jgi:lipid-binding SYLF domain-containing protein
MHDSETDFCLFCNKRFDTSTWRHHCRNCGGIFCDDCSSERMLIPPSQIVAPPHGSTSLFEDFDANEPQRVCKSCAATLSGRQEDLLKILSRSNQEVDIDRSNSERYLNLPIHFNMTDEIKKASYILWNFTSDNAIEGEDSIPRELLWGACGLVFLTFVKVGFFFTGRVGTGLIVAKLPDGRWSAPSAVGSTGLGWGFQLGGEVTDVIIILNTPNAVEAFCSDAQVALGTELGISLGPLGRSAGTDLHAGEGGITAAFSYAHSKGLFIGVSLEASVLFARNEINRAFYGKGVLPHQILRGDVPRPRAAMSLYSAINEVQGLSEDGQLAQEMNGGNGSSSLLSREEMLRDPDIYKHHPSATSVPDFTASVDDRPFEGRGMTSLQSSSSSRRGGGQQYGFDREEEMGSVHTELPPTHLMGDYHPDEFLTDTNAGQGQGQGQHQQQHQQHQQHGMYSMDPYQSHGNDSFGQKGGGKEEEVFFT